MGRRTVRGKGPMLAKLEQTLPTGDGWTYEPKWDGFRCLVTAEAEAVSFVSRDDRPMMRFFPEIVTMLEGLDAGAFVADGELVLVRADGTLSFEELQLRLHPAASRVQKLAGRSRRRCSYSTCCATVTRICGNGRCRNGGTISRSSRRGSARPRCRRSPASCDQVRRRG